MDSFPPARILAQDVGAITISSETLLEDKPWLLSRLILRTSMLCGTQSFSTLRQWFLHMDVDLLMASSESCSRSTFERKGLRAQRRLMLQQEKRIRLSQITPRMHLPMHLPMHLFQITIWELSSRFHHRQCHLQNVQFTFIIQRQFPQTSLLVWGQIHIVTTMPFVLAVLIWSIRRTSTTRPSGLLHARIVIPSSTQGKPGRLSPHADVRKSGTKCPFLHIG